MNAKKILAASTASAVGLLSSASVALAQDLPTITVNVEEKVAITDVGKLISGFVGAAILISALLVFGYLVIGGVQWITSGGDKGKTEAARNKITAALVGLAIVASAYAIMRIIGFFFGVDIFGGGIQTTLQQIKPY